MGRRFRKEVQEWSKGAVVSTATAVKVPDNSASRARNAAWVKSGFPAKRKGVSIVTPSAQSGKNPILNGGNFLGFNWVIDGAGRWSKIVSGVYSAIDAGNPTPFTPGNSRWPSFTVAHNLLFACNGLDAKKTDFATVSAWGFSAPAAPTVSDSGVAGNSNGTYLIGLTAYNHNTGHQSSLSTTNSVTVAGHKITVSWVFPTDPQITDVRVHIFKNSLSSKFFQLVGADVTPAANTYGGYDSGTTSITINVTDTDINNLIIASPDQFENNPPPASITYCQWHNGRMFVTDGKYLYYSKLDDPESFDPRVFEVVNTGDNQNINAFVSLSDQQMIIIKDTSCHALIGPNDPNTWDIQPLDPTVGIKSFRSITLTEGAIWWEALQGIFRVQYSTELGVIAKPTRMDAPNMSDRIESITENQLPNTCAVYDALHQRLFFAVPVDTEAIPAEVEPNDGGSSTRNTAIIPWNNKSQIWEDIWDPMDTSALMNFIDDNGNPYVALGNYKGRVFRMWDLPYVDGVRQTDGTTLFTLKGTVTSATANTLTDTGATFDTANDALIEIPVVAVSPGGLEMRNIIQSNTGTVLTLNNNWIVIPSAGWTYYVGSPNFVFDTSHFHPTSVPGQEGSEFNSRNFKKALLRGATDTGQSQLTVLTIVDGDFSTFDAIVTMPISSGGAQWDIDKWDLAQFGTDKITTAKTSLGVRGKTCGLRIINREPGQGVILLTVGLYGTEHSESD